MNYIGSKNKLLKFIDVNIYNIVGNLQDKIFCDLFAGTGTVGSYFKPKSKKIISNDMETYSYILNRNYIGNHKEFDYSNILYELNNLEGVKGFIYNNYCFGSGSDRLYFSDENGMKIDAIRQEISKLKDSNKINDDMYYFLLASLLESADKVANTASVYGAFLKKLKSTALKNLNLIPAKFYINDHDHDVYQEDANKLIHNITGDILYLDPPYNARQYGANYHILNTIALYDDFVPKGKTGLREYNRSDYCKKATVTESFEEIIKNADFKYIFLSYNNEGLMPAKEIQNIMQKYGSYDLATQEYQRFKADVNRDYIADKTVEYLHILEK